MAEYQHRVMGSKSTVPLRIIQLFFFLLFWLGHVSAASDVSYGSAIYKPCDLDDDTCRDLLDCLNDVNGSFRMYVDHQGFIVVLPESSRSFDLFSSDARVLRCMERVSDRLDLIAEGAVEPQKEHKQAIPLRDVTCEWLQAHGAQGKTRAGIRSSTSRGLSQHQHHDDPEYVDACRNWNSPWYSVQFEDSSVEYNLLAAIWPHHRCLKGNS